MARYILVKNDIQNKGVEGFAVGANPYRRVADSRDIERDATPWQVWFYAVEALDPRALKTRVPESFHGLIDGGDSCPVCGGTLTCQPGADRYRMKLACPECEGTWDAEDADERQRQESWAAWQREHGQPRSLSEFWAMQAEGRGEVGDVAGLAARPTL